MKDKKVPLEISDDFQWYCIMLTSENDHLEKFRILQNYISINGISNFSVLLDEHANQKQRDLKKEEVKFNDVGIKRLAKFLCNT